ncbi:Threonyl/alanyl tRNA synthetase [Hysterangium stoloniferum]|nr:Threonyl/alanyl tRNA synthetase [Hysterangium stoloniferum]
MAAAATVLPPTEFQPYHRILSPTLQIPTDISQPVPVGLLACQRDPFLKELDTNVIQCKVSQGLEVSKDKKKKATGAPLQESVLEVLLHDTILFPEGGGQPSDIGYVKGPEGSLWEVLEVKRHGGHAIHYVKGGDILPAGTPITVMLGDAGFKRRYDHMCMHTSQHLISALLERLLSLPTPSWYLTPSPNPSYIEVPRAPTEAELQTIEDAANKYCMSGTRLHIEVEELSDKCSESGDRNASKGLPADYTGGVNRTVVIENVDRNPCCGTHLPTLQGQSIFILPQTESLSRGRARIFFCAGPRIRAYLAQTHGLLTTAAVSYGCAPAQVAERLLFETDGRRKANKRTEELEREVADFVVQDLQEEKRQVIKSEASVFTPRFCAFRHRYDSSSNPLNLLNLIHKAWSLSPTASSPHLIVIAASAAQTSSNNVVLLVFGTDENEVKEFGDKLKAKGIKGGGKSGKWSGKTDDWRGAGGDEGIKALFNYQ